MRTVFYYKKKSKKSTEKYHTKKTRGASCKATWLDFPVAKNLYITMQLMFVLNWFKNVYMQFPKKKSRKKTAKKSRKDKIDKNAKKILTFHKTLRFTKKMRIMQKVQIIKIWTMKKIQLYNLHITLLFKDPPPKISSNHVGKE